MSKVWEYLWSSSKANPVENEKNSKGECPVQHSNEKNPLNYISPMDPSIRTPETLSEYRVQSNIPKGDFTPEHQMLGKSKSSCPHAEGSDDKWVYPSEAQYYNAMKV